VSGGGEREKGGHVLRDTTSRGLYVRVWPPHTSERREDSMSLQPLATAFVPRDKISTAAGASEEEDEDEVDEEEEGQMRRRGMRR